MKIRVAAVQMCSVPDRTVNLKSADRFITEAASDGARIVSLPENFSFLGSQEQKAGHGESPSDSRTLGYLQEQALRHRIFLIGGSIPILTSDPTRVSNSCFAVGPGGEILARYDKLHLFDVAIDEANTFRESEHVEPGHAVVTLEAAGLTLGLTICFDLRFPELYRRLAGAGSDVVFVPSAFTVPTGKAHWEVLLRARAIENQCYVVAPAQMGEHISGRTSYGKSMIVDPWGAVLAVAPDRPGIICADIDTEVIEDVRDRLPALARRRNDLFPS
jgi:nitrilase